MRNTPLFLVLALLAAACGAEVSTTTAPPTPDGRVLFTQAAEALSALDTFRFRIEVKSDQLDSELGTRAFTAAGSGTIDLTNDATELHLEYGGNGWEEMGGNDLPRHADQIRIGETTYVRGLSAIAFAGFNDFDGEAWYVVKEDEIELDAVLASLVHGDELAALLAAAESIEYRAEVLVDGVATTHLQALVTRSRLDELGGQYPDSILDLDLALEGSPVSFDIWLDVDGLPRRLKLETDELDTFVTHLEFTIELFDFGADFNIVAPAGAIDPPLPVTFSSSD